MTPTCPNCGNRLVFVALAIQSAGVMYKTWQCDCNYRNPEDEATVPGDIIGRIEQARERGDVAGICMVEFEVSEAA